MKPFLTLGTAPATLSNQETAGQNLRVDFSRLLVNDRLLSLYDSAGLALVIDTNDLVAQLKLATSASRRERLQDSQLALAVDTMAVVKLGNTRDMGSLLAGIKISDLLVSELEG